MWAKFWLFGLDPVVYMINADISILYLVQIVGLWVSSLLIRNHCSCSYKSLPTAGDCRTKLPQSHSATQDKNRQRQTYQKQKKETENALHLCRCHFKQRTVLQTEIKA
jgi:hypothetical protein